MLGADLGTYSIKVVRISRGAVEEARQATCPAFPSRSSDDSRQLLRRIAQERRWRGQQVWGSIKGTAVIPRLTKFPAMPEEDLRGAVALEAEEFVSRNWSQMDFDYDVVEELPDGKVRVLFVAAPRELSEEQVQCFKASGLYCGGITLDSLALTNAFLRSATDAQKEANVLLLNIGAQTTNIVLLNAGQLTVLRDVAFGGNDVNEAVMTDFNATFEEAEAIKLNAGEGGAQLDGSVERAVEPLLRQVSRTIGYEARRREEAGDLSVCLFGGGSLAPGLDRQIASGIDSPVEHFDPFPGLPVRCELPEDAGLRSCFAVAVGAALTGEQEL